MISPELVFPEEYAATAESAEQEGPVSRMLVLLDPERPIKYPLFKETMTIGRADIDGTEASVEPEFIAGASNPQGIGVNATHIYWANQGAAPRPDSPSKTARW